MNTNINHAPHCQIGSVPVMGQPISRMAILKQIPNRLKRFSKRRLFFFNNLLKEFFRRDRVDPTQNPHATSNGLKEGDLVKIKTKKEIQALLDPWGVQKGCAFMEEMWDYCETEHKVIKKVNQFMDERTYLIKKARGLVLLDGVYCRGTKDFGLCDRMCFFFWREEWLSKIESSPTKQIG